MCPGVLLSHGTEPEAHGDHPFYDMSSDLTHAIDAPRWESYGRRVVVVAVATIVTVGATFLRIASMNGFPNDHFVSLSRGVQMLLGEWPVRDFVDPGLPLMYALSAVGQVIGGRTLFAEAVLVAVAFGVSAGLTVWIVHRWCGSLALGVWAAFAEFAVFPRSYSYPKILLHVIAAAAFIAYARRTLSGPAGRSLSGPARGTLSDPSTMGPPRRMLLGFAVLCTIAFLFRHDHGLFIGAATLVLIAASELHRGFARAARAVFVFGAATAALIALYAAYVQVNGGLAPYLQSAATFSQIEAERSRLGWDPLYSMSFSAGEGVSAIGFAVLWVAPVAAGVVVLARWRSIPPADRAIVMAIVVMSVCVNTGFLRNPLTARVPDAIVPCVLLIAWIARQVWISTPGHRVPAIVGRGFVIAALAAVAYVTADVGVFAERLRQTEANRGLEKMRQRWAEVTQELRSPYAERQMPSNLARALVPFFEYVQACTRRDDRMLVTGFAPEIPYYARRGFAGGHVNLFNIYYSSDADQRRTLDRLQRQSVPLVVVPPESAAELSGTFPLIHRYVQERYTLMTEINVHGYDEPARIFVRKEVAVAPRYQATNWPCISPEPLATR